MTNPSPKLEKDFTPQPEKNQCCEKCRGYRNVKCSCGCHYGLGGTCWCVCPSKFWPCINDTCPCHQLLSSQRKQLIEDLEEGLKHIAIYHCDEGYRGCEERPISHYSVKDVLTLIKSLDK